MLGSSPPHMKNALARCCGRPERRIILLRTRPAGHVLRHRGLLGGCPVEDDRFFIPFAVVDDQPAAFGLAVAHNDDLCIEYDDGGHLSFT